MLYYNPNQYGSRVVEVQQKLGIQADGYFGPQTLTAVKNFQHSHGLDDDGIVGPLTQAKLSEVASSTGMGNFTEKAALTVIKKDQTSYFICHNEMYYVQSDKGNITINGVKYFEANSEETVSLYKVYSIDYDFQFKEYIDCIKNALPDKNISYIDKLKYVYKESHTGGQLDQKQYLNEDKLYLFNGKLYNKNEAGWEYQNKITKT